MDLENNKPLKSNNCVPDKDNNIVEIETEGSEINNIQKHKPIDFVKNCYSVNCPYCQQIQTTRVVKKPSKCLYLTLIPLCLLPPLCFLPFCIDSFYNKFHFCAVCGRQIGCHKSFSKPNIPDTI